MYIEYNGILSDAQDETTVDSHISDNVVDWGAAGRRFYEPLWYVFRIDTAIVSAGGGTLRIQMVTSAAEALTSNTVLWDSGVIANATIVAWAVGAIPYVIPVVGQGTLLQYFGAIYTIGTDVFTAGAWDMLPVINPPAPIL
ncbi:MAG: Bbp16 family capsid cement protein [bacterium]